MRAIAELSGALDDNELDVARFLASYHDLIVTGADQRTISRFLESHAALASELQEELRAIDLLDTGIEPQDRETRLQPKDFRIGRLVGAGSFGVVYEAIQLSLSRRVALKILSAAALDRPGARRRFEQEGKAAAAISHNNVVAIHDMGVEDGTAYIAMEYIEGDSLSRVLERLRSADLETLEDDLDFGELTRGALLECSSGSPSFLTKLVVESGATAVRPPEIHRRAPGRLSSNNCLGVAAAFAEVAEGLQAIHQKNIIHRDLKPANIMVDAAGRLKIVDFGLAFVEGKERISLTNERPGTPLYMSPEQVQGNGHEITRRCDVYSLGATLYETLTLHPAFTGRTVNELLEKIISCDPTSPRRLNPHIPESLERIVLKCLRKEPAKRYGTAEALAQDLRRFVRGEEVEAEDETLADRLARSLRRARKHAGWVAAVACGVLALSIAGGQVIEKGHQRDADAAAQKEARWKDLVIDGVGLIVRHQLLVRGTNASLLDEEKILVPLPKDDALAVDQVEGLESEQYELQPIVFETGAAIADVGPDPLRKAEERLRAATDLCPGRAEAHYHLARALALLGDTPGALQEASRALALRPGFDPAVALTAWIAQPEPETRAGEQATRLDAARDPTWAGNLLLAQRAFHESDWGAAAEAYATLCSAPVDADQDERYLGAFLEHRPLLAWARLKMNDQDGARFGFQACADRYPKRIEPVILLYKSQWHGGSSATPSSVDRAKRAAETFEDYYQDTPGESRAETAASIAAAYQEVRDFEAALRWVSRLEPGAARLCLESSLYSSQGKGQEAVNAALHALELESGRIQSHLALGNAWLALGARQRRDGDSAGAAQSFSRAGAAYETARGLDASDPRPLLALGACFEQEGNLPGAVGVVRKACELKGYAAGAHYSLARLYSWQDKLSEACAEYETVIALDPGHAPAYNNLGTTLDRKGLRRQALEAYERAARVAPENGLIHYNLAWTFQRLRRFREASVEYRRALELGVTADGLTPTQLAICLQHLPGDASSRLELLGLYEKAVEVNPDLFVAQRSLAVLREWGGSHCAAVDPYREAVRLQADLASIHDELGHALDRCGQESAAVHEYLQALRLDPKHGWTFNHLADLLLRSKSDWFTGEQRANLLPAFEDAADLPNVIAGVPQLVERYRRSFAPRIVTYASVDARLREPVPLVEESASWRFFKGRIEPSEPLGWTRSDFNDTDWQEDEGGFSFPLQLGARTALVDMQGSYSSLYLRRRFHVEDAGRFDRVSLRVRCDGGFLAYLNGEEVGRVGVVKPGEWQAFSVTAAATEMPPWMWMELELAPGKLVSGDNVLAIHGFKGDPEEDFDFFLAASLTARPRFDTSSKEQAAAALEAFRARSEGSADAARVLYFEARLLQLEGDLQGAAWKLREVLALDSSRPEPYLRAAECLIALGSHVAADGMLREAIGSGLADHDQLWDAWFRLHAVDMRQGAREILESFPPRPEPIRGQAPRRSHELYWLVKELVERRAVRINCGGAGYEEPDGRSWSHDRFYRCGDPIYLGRLDESQSAPGAPALYRTERYFPEPSAPLKGYSFPLPVGTYRVTLHFVEGYCKKAGERVFHVLLNGQRILEGYEPLRAGFGVPDLKRSGVDFEHPVVAEGLLEIDFERVLQYPKISAIEIEPL